MVSCARESGAKAAVPYLKLARSFLPLCKWWSIRSMEANDGKHFLYWWFQNFSKSVGYLGIKERPHRSSLLGLNIGLNGEEVFQRCIQI